jgi:cold shock CspA family protein
MQNRGFGFIKPDAVGEREVFCPARNVNVDAADVEKGQAVEYEVRANERDGRPEAFGVKVLQ